MLLTIENLIILMMSWSEEPCLHLKGAGSANASIVPVCTLVLLNLGTSFMAHSHYRKGSKTSVKYRNPMPRWVRNPMPHWVRNPMPHWVRNPMPNWVRNPMPHWVRNPMPHWVRNPMPHWVRNPMPHWVLNQRPLVQSLYCGLSAKPRVLTTKPGVLSTNPSLYPQNSVVIYKAQFAI